MKYLDQIEIISNNYEKFGVPKGTKGTIITAEIRNLCFECAVDCSVEILPIKIYDLKVIKSSNLLDDAILDALPQNNPHWWCKVEDGFILNLLGKKKNKIAYKFNS